MAERKLNILSVEAHYDDAAFLWMGQLAQWMGAGHNVDSLVFTNSDGQGKSRLRMFEQRKMMDKVGMRHLYPVGMELNLPDGGLSLQHVQTMTPAFTYILDQAIANGQPYDKVVSFGPDAATGHNDHFVTWQVIKSVFDNCESYSQTWTEFWQVGLSPQQRKTWLPYFIPIPEQQVTNYLAVDITSQLTTKIAAVVCHDSQLATGGSRHIERLLQEKPPLEYFRIYARNE